LLLTWSAVFLIQFVMGRRELENIPLRVVTALMQVAAITIPAVLLVQALRGSHVRTWQRNSVVWWSSLTAMIALALHHVHAIRTISAQSLPYSAYVIGNLTSAALLGIALPAAILLVMSMWIAARRHAKWKALDVAAVVYGCAVLLFLCLLSGGAHPLDHVNRTLGETWNRLACTIFPIGAGATAVVLWLRAANRDD
jgi:fucose 4-O-acetylase-like acetyltransferase